MPNIKTSSMLRGEGMLEEAIDAATDPSDRVREWAAHVLGGIDGDRARRTLEGLATSDDSDIVALTARHARSVDHLAIPDDSVDIRAGSMPNSGHSECARPSKPSIPARHSTS
jgi:hypothetical protein